MGRWHGRARPTTVGTWCPRHVLSVKQGCGAGGSAWARATSISARCPPTRYVFSKTFCAQIAPGGHGAGHAHNLWHSAFTSAVCQWETVPAQVAVDGRGAARVHNYRHSAPTNAFHLAAGRPTQVVALWQLNQVQVRAPCHRRGPTRFLRF